MTIVASGEISLGGNATATRSVACELARSGTAQICMNESAVRTLAGVPSGQISMSNFYGKSNVPTGLGQSYKGGYYIGTINSPANYYLIVAPNASGCACCVWKTQQTITGNYVNATCTNNNGYWNTYTYLTDGTHPAGNWARTRSINGFNDWYLPARNELNVMYTNKGTPPAGEQFACDNYWSSSECTFFAYNVYFQNFTNGLAGNGTTKNYNLSLRAVRREPF